MIIPDALQNEMSLWIQGLPMAEGTIARANKVFEIQKARQLRKMSHKYGVPMDILENYYKQ